MISRLDPATARDYEFVPQAIVKRSPAFFVDRGILFRADVDDLNEFQVAELAVDDLPFALLRHEGTPPDETTVYLPTTVSLERVPDVIALILRQFDLPAGAIGWHRRTPDSPF